MTGGPLLEVDAVSVNFGALVALNRVSLAIDRGEIIFQGEPRAAFDNDEVMRTLRG